PALLVEAAIPDHDATVVGWSLEGVAIDVVVSDLDRQALDRGVERRPLRHGPGTHDAGELEAQVEVARGGGMLLDDERAGADAADRELLVALDWRVLYAQVVDGR